MAESSSSSTKKSPTSVIVLGMAGSGKTSLVSRLANSTTRKPYVLNLDPAVLHVPYHAHIDIRDSVHYKDVMKEYNVGPNGAIVTSLNLFTTKFGQVLECIEQAPYDLCVLDTPGQIEVFTWSVSGAIITETLAASVPTVILYVIDSVSCTSPVTFMSNMLYACSLLYKTRLPFIVVMNKVDIVDHSYALDWIQNFEAFEEALENDEGYISSLMRTLALTLEEFYRHLKLCGVSATTGQGIDDLYKLLDEARITYETEYRVEWEKMKKAQVERKVLEEDSLVHEVPAGADLNDVFLRQPGEQSSSDSEGEEAPFESLDDDKEAETFRKALQQQRELQIKRAKEAEEKKAKT